MFSMVYNKRQTEITLAIFQCFSNSDAIELQVLTFVMVTNYCKYCILIREVQCNTSIIPRGSLLNLCILNVHSVYSA